MRNKTVLKSEALEEFQQIPGVGKKISEDFWNIGLRSLKDLENADPDLLYEKICLFQHCQVDRCMLYVLRCAVYFATHEPPHDPYWLKWWNWKDRH